MINQKTRTEAQKKNLKRIILFSVLTFGIMVIVILLIFLAELPKTGKVHIVVAPTSAKVKIGGKSFNGGTHSIEPGRYEVEVEKDEFESYHGQIVIQKDITTPLMVCLQKKEGNEEYYASHQEDQDACYTVEEYTAEQLEEEKFKSEKIFTVAPYHSYGKGFYVDPYFDDNDVVHIKITLVTCSAERAEGLKQNALEWLAAQEIDTSKYRIEYSSCAYGD